MRSGPRAGATRSRAVFPPLRPGPRASRADLDIIEDYVFSGGRLRSAIRTTLRGVQLSAARTVSPATEFRRDDDDRGVRAGDTVLVTATVARGATLHLARRSRTFFPPAPALRGPAAARPAPA